MNIGYVNPGYPVLRTILEKCPECEYTRVRSFASAVIRLNEKLRRPTNFSNVYLGGIGQGNADLMHFFNMQCIAPCRKPYVTTFETFLPRFPAGERGVLWGMAKRSLESKRCRNLIAISEAARKIQQLKCEEFGLDGVMEKTVTLLPPQDLLTDEKEIARKFDRRATGGRIRFAFVGKDFFRKGGGEIVRAFASVRKKYPVELLLVGDFSRHDYTDCVKYDDSQRIAKLIDDNKDWIEFHEALPNSKVLARLKECDAGLLPTRAETFGYSVLEMQATGLPCITTDIRALPEINNEKCGWLIQVPKDRLGNAVSETATEREELCERIEDGLERIVAEICESPFALREKSMEAFGRVAREHDPKDYGERLNTIYREAMMG